MNAIKDSGIGVPKRMLRVIRGGMERNVIGYGGNGFGC